MGGGDPAGLAGGAGGKAPRGIALRIDPSAATTAMWTLKQASQVWFP